MKAFFPVVGEKEYKDTTLRTEQRQFVFTKLHVESVFISFVSFSFNKRHVSAPPRTKIREIGEICVQDKNIRVIRVIRVQKKYSVRSVCPPKKNFFIRVIPKAPLDFFMGFFDMNVAGRRDYALMTEALLVKPV